jgi:hypothetical protein
MGITAMSLRYRLTVCKPDEMEERFKKKEYGKYGKVTVKWKWMSVDMKVNGEFMSIHQASKKFKLSYPKLKAKCLECGSIEAAIASLNMEKKIYDGLSEGQTREASGLS